MNETIDKIQEWIGDGNDEVGHLTDGQADDLLNWLEENEFNGEINENWDKLDKFWGTLILPLEAIRNLDYENGQRLLKQLNDRTESEWKQTDTAVENDHNLNCDYIIDEYYHDEKSGQTVSWVSYWNTVHGDEDNEVLTDKAHWEIVESITKVQIGIKYMIHAMQVEGFGYDEIMTMRNAMISRDFSKINFVES